MKVRIINIDSLVLDGFGRQYALGFAQGLKQELSRLVRENDVGNISDMDALNAGVLRLAAGAKPELAGAQTARSIFRRFERR